MVGNGTPVAEQRRDRLSDCRFPGDDSFIWSVKTDVSSGGRSVTNSFGDD